MVSMEQKSSKHFIQAALDQIVIKEGSAAKGEVVRLPPEKPQVTVKNPNCW